MATIGKVADIKTSPDFTLGEAFAIGVAKTASERFLAQYPRMNGKPLVGNATLKSGVIKLALAGVAWKGSQKGSGLMAKTSRVASTAWTVDGVEDMIAGALRYFAPKLSQQEENTVGAI